MGKASRDKGKRGEREVAELLRDHGIDLAERRQDFERVAQNQPAIPDDFLAAQRNLRSVSRIWSRPRLPLSRLDLPIVASSERQIVAGFPVCRRFG